VRALNIEDVVHFLGWREDVYALMRAFDLFVHSPVQPDPLPTVCIHALAVGCPSVGYDTGGVGEIILDGECGELAPVGDVEALAAAMERMYSNPQLRRTYATSSLRHFSERFSYAGFVKNVRSIFKMIQE
jgi:glycosyltransferase involved in cell wall biosynthesis